MSKNVENNFNLAANFIQSNHQRFNNRSDLLKFYAFYKQSTIGALDITQQSRPSFFKIQERAKYDAWAALGSMDRETAMKSYVELLTSLDPDWKSEVSQESKGSDGSFGVSVSRPKVEKILDSEKSIEDFIREGNVVKLKELLKDIDESDLNSLDENGLGLIHWASDRGNVEVLKVILSTSGININLTDGEGQTALHYASSCSHYACVELLLQYKVNKNVLDNDGTLAADAADDEKIKLLLR
jgi:acyl-CoA-binding protein